MKQASCWVALGVALLVAPFGCGDSTSSPRGGSANVGVGGEGGSAELGGGADGDEPTAASSGQTQGGDPGTNGGDAAVGGAAGATDVAGAPATDGGGGAGGDDSVATAGCKVFADCDDGIACTVDRCNLNHVCSHQADNSVCEAAPGECMGCDVGVGCVPRATTSTELLLDKDFDQLSGIWKEASATYVYAIFESDYADTVPYLAEFGPAAFDASEQEHAILSQSFVIPAGTQKLTFKGSYQLSPGGTQLDIEDSTRVALHLGASAPEAYLFNVWLGIEPEVLFWKTFSYEASRDEISTLLGKTSRLQFEANTWDTIFAFDSVSLKATVCPQ